MKFFKWVIGNSCDCEKQIAELDKKVQGLESEVQGFNNRVNTNTHKISTLEGYHNEPEPPTNNYPEQVPNSEQYGTYNQDTNVKPYLEWQESTLSNSRYCRIGDREVFGATNNAIRHNYSLVQPFNADGSLIMFSAAPQPHVLDGNTYEHIKTIPVNSTARWSHIDPNIIYLTRGNRFIEYNYQTNRETTLKTFDYNVEITSKGNSDNFDKIIALKSGNRVVVYNIQTNEILSTKTFSNVKWVMTSQLGNYIVIGYNANGTGANQGVKSYTINLANEKHLCDSTPHGDVQIDIAGNEVFVGFGDQPQWSARYAFFMSRLDTGEVTNLYPYVSGKGIWWGHLSGRNTKRAGYVYISHDTPYSYELADKEMYAIKLDSSGLVERIGKHDNNARPTGNDSHDYNHQTQLVPNQTGLKVIYASNNNNNEEKQKDAAPSYVLEML